MARFHRFEDALSAWRAHARLAIGPAGADAALCPDGNASADGGRPSPDPAGVLARRFVPACLAWMAEQGCWPNSAADMKRVGTEVESAVRGLIGPQPEGPPEQEVPGSAWAVPAAAGSAIGALILEPLTLLWFENRSIGLFAGGALGAFIAVQGVAALLGFPQMVSALRAAAGLSAGALVAGGLWRAIRGQWPGIFRAALWLLAAPLVISVLKPRPATIRRDAPAAVARRAAELVHATDLTLAVAWAHPERLASPGEERPTEAGLLAGPACAALTRLQAELARSGSDRDLREACEDLFQRLQEDGYAWRSLAPGAPYPPEMADVFETFGTIAPGQAVRTQRAAMIRRGQVIQKGELRRT